MFTTGFKFFFGLGVALVTAAFLYGYTSGGNHVGPLSLGWKGGVGEHVGYGILLGLGVSAIGIALTLIFFRDADPADQADYLEVDDIAPTAPVTGSLWPVVGAFGVGTMAIGLVLNMLVLQATTWYFWHKATTNEGTSSSRATGSVAQPVDIREGWTT